MRTLLALFALVATAIFCSPAADACLMHKIYPALWRHPPLFPGEQAVVLKVALVAHASRDFDEVEVRTTCDGGAYVFKVLKVLRGKFPLDEAAIVLPVSGAFFDDPIVGDERIIVGKRLEGVRLGDRYVDNLRELKGVSHAILLERSKSTKVAGPSTVMAIQPRPPIEQRLLFLFGAPGPTLLVGIAGMGIFALAVLLRLKSRGRRSTR